LIGLVALGLTAGAFVLTWFFLTGGIQASAVNAFADFQNCGQGLREGGDVKLRGVLVGTIGKIERTEEKLCRVELELFPEDTEHVPANAMAQIRAKTVFGEKWVEVLLPENEDADRIAENDVIPVDRTIDPLEVETIMNTGMPLLEAVDPENLAATLQALVEGFRGHEDAARRGITQGQLALAPFIENDALFNKGITQLDEASQVFQDTDQTLLQALDNLHQLNEFTIENRALIEESLQKTPELLRELGTLFEQKFKDIEALVNSGATVIGIIADRTDDLDKLLEALPKFNSAWIRNLDHACRARQAGGEVERGDRIPGRCWRVHNLITDSRHPYTGDPAQDCKPPDAYDNVKCKSESAQEEEQEEQLVIGPDGERMAVVPRLLYAPVALQTAEGQRR
jgi:virulence factor Mce-like protein